MYQIEIKNNSLTRVVGWKRVTANKWTTHNRGNVVGRKYALGRNLGLVNRTLDIHVDLQPGAMLRVSNLQLEGKADPWQDTYLDDELNSPVTHFGVPEVGGVPLALIFGPNKEPWIDDGACKLVKFAQRIRPMLYAEMWIHWYPGQRWANGVLSVTCSNSSLPDLTADLVMDFRMGGNQIFIHPINPDYIGDGQTRAVPFTVVFGGASQEDVDSARAFAQLQVVGRGVDALGPLGLAHQARFNPVNWMNQNLFSVWFNLSNYNSSQVGVIANSTVSGDSEDQCFGWHQEALYPGGTGCEQVRYLAALGQARQPCHHLNHDGTPVSMHNHPQLVLWQGRPHFNRGVSPDQLGKLRQLSQVDTHGWWGPDREHLLINTLVTAYELTGCPFLQRELQFHARNFLLEDTIKAGWSTSGADVPRSRGWRGLFVTHLWRCLEDRSLAQEVKQRWMDRMDMVYIPSQKTQWLWGPMPTRPEYFDSTTYPYMSMLYQIAVGVYGEWLACYMLDHKVGMLMAIEQAGRVIKHAYDETNREWEIIGLLPNGEPAALPYQEGNDAHRTGWFRFKWLPFAVWTAIKHPEKEVSDRAIELYKQLLSEYVVAAGSNPIQADWFVPI